MQPEQLQYCNSRFTNCATTRTLSSVLQSLRCEGLQSSRHSRGELQPCTSASTVVGVGHVGAQLKASNGKSVNLWSTQSVVGDSSFRTFMSRTFRPCLVKLSTELLRRWCSRKAIRTVDNAALRRGFVEAQITRILCDWRPALVLQSCNKCPRGHPDASAQQRCTGAGVQGRCAGTTRRWALPAAVRVETMLPVAGQCGSTARWARRARAGGSHFFVWSSLQSRGPDCAPYPQGSNRPPPFFTGCLYAFPCTSRQPLRLGAKLLVG